MTASASAPVDPQPQRYWRRVLRLTGALLLLWSAVTFGGVFFARDLAFDFFGWPFGFWLAAQGAVIGYVVLVAGYAYALNRLDRAHGVDEGRASAR